MGSPCKQGPAVAAAWQKAPASSAASCHKWRQLRRRSQAPCTISKSASRRLCKTENSAATRHVANEQALEVELEQTQNKVRVSEESGCSETPQAQVQ